MQLQTQPVTKKMEEQASRPLTAAMKQWMEQLIKDSEEELKACMIKTTEKQTRKLEDAMESQTKKLKGDISTLQQGVDQQNKQLQDIASTSRTMEAAVVHQTRNMEGRLRLSLAID